MVDSVTEAFATLLHNGSRYYVPKADTPVERAIAMVRAADAAGLAVEGLSGAGLRLVLGGAPPRSGQVIGRLQPSRRDAVDIEKGLAAGERVVVDGQMRLSNGTRVDVRSAETPKAAQPS